MTKKNLKRVLTIVFTLAMLFSLSMVSFAAGPPVNIIVRYADYDLTTHQYSYTYLDSFISEGYTAYEAVDAGYGSAATWTYYYGGSYYLDGITINNIDYSSMRVEASDSCYAPGGYNYLGGDSIIDSLNQLPDFVAYGGVDISYARLFDDDAYAGYYFMGNSLNSCSITYDWICEVDYSADGYGNFVNPGCDMSSLALDNYDIIRLTYSLVWVIF